MMAPTLGFGEDVGELWFDWAPTDLRTLTNGAASNDTEAMIIAAVK